MIEVVLNIITLGLKPLYEKNLSFYKLINEFRKKLPRPQNEARKLSENELHKHLSKSETLNHFGVFDLSYHKPSLTENELDVFFNSLRDFDYGSMFFKSYYKSFSSNILRLRPKSKNGDLDLVVLQEVLRDCPLHPLKYKDVLVYHLKYKYKLTKNLYFRFFKQKQTKNETNNKLR